MDPPLTPISDLWKVATATSGKISTNKETQISKGSLSSWLPKGKIRNVPLHSRSKLAFDTVTLCLFASGDKISDHMNTKCVCHMPFSHNTDTTIDLYKDVQNCS